MLSRHQPDRIRIAFDDQRLVANAGLLLPACSCRPPSPCALACPNWLTGTWTWAMQQAEPTPATR